jgi:hypothetical protein
MLERRSSRHRAPRLLLAASLAAFAPACEAVPTPSAPTPQRLPAWQGHAQEVFDDGIDPSAVGLALDAFSPRLDRALRERAQMGEIVARVRVQTVTIDSVGEQSSYHLGLQIGVPPLAEPKIPDRSFELSIRPNNRSYTIVKAFESRLRGSTFVGFLHRFQGEGGEAEVHWHLSADTAEIAAAIKEAIALRELSGT